MKHLKIEGIVEKRFEKLNEAFDMARLHFHEDDIRIFRVKVKKLEACLGLIDAAKAHSRPVKLLPKMVKVNQLFGEIRTLQMQQNHVQDRIKEMNIGSPDAYLKFISDQILQHMEDIGKELKGNQPFNKEEDKMMDLLPQQLSKEAILQFVRSEGDIVEKLLEPIFPADKSFHEVRKHLKNLLYISPYVNLGMAALSPYKLLDNFEAIDEFTKVLGKFQDMNTALECLYCSAPKIDADENEKISLRKLEEIWVEAREAFRVQIYDEIQKIIASGRTAATPVEWVVM